MPKDAPQNGGLQIRPGRGDAAEAPRHHQPVLAGAEVVLAQPESLNPKVRYSLIAVSFAGSSTPSASAHQRKFRWPTPPCRSNSTATTVNHTRVVSGANVLLLQSVTAMLPAIVSQLVVIVKDTALGGALLYFSELIAQARPAQSFYGANVIATLVIAVIFIVINSLLSWFASWLERWLRQHKKGTGTFVGGDLVRGSRPLACISPTCAPGTMRVVTDFLTAPRSSYDAVAIDYATHFRDGLAASPSRGRC